MTVSAGLKYSVEICEEVAVALLIFEIPYLFVGYIGDISCGVNLVLEMLSF